MLVAAQVVCTFSSSSVMATTTLHCGTWQVDSSPNPVEDGNTLYAAAAISASNAWAVGNYYVDTPAGGFYLPLIEHWNGTQWSLVASPFPPNSDYNWLRGVSATSADDIWAVGYTYSNALIEHWDGTKWSIILAPAPSGNAPAFAAVTSLSANNVWAVGNMQTGNYQLQTLIAHWDGTQWSVIPSPNLGSLNNELSGIAAVSANDIWAVGEAYDNSGIVQTLIEHWDGTQWSIIPSPNPGQIAHLQGVTAISSSNVWAVGTSYGQTLVEHWNGTSWSVIPSPNPGGVNNILEAVTTVSANDIWATGGYVLNQQTSSMALIEHWNGTSWDVTPDVNPWQSNWFYGAMSAGGNHVWAVGDNSNPGEKTLIESDC